MVNSFSLKSNDLTSTEAVGTGLYLGGSYFDHSCRPNARADFRANEIVILATEDILADDDLNNVM